AGTDSRHYAEIADNIFRFSPVRANAEDLKRFHGTNERLSIEGYGDMIRFYRRLIENTAGGRCSRHSGMVRRTRPQMCIAHRGILGFRARSFHSRPGMTVVEVAPTPPAWAGREWRRRRAAC